MLSLVDDLAAWNDFPWGEYYWEEFHNKVVNLIDIRQNNHIECKKYNPDKLPTYTIHGFAWRQDSNPTTKLQLTNAKMGHNWYRSSYDYLDVKEKFVPLDDLGGVSRDDESDAYTRQDGRGATVGAKVSGEAMNDADISAVVHEDPSDAAIDGEHMDAVGHPNENEGPNEKEDPSDAAIDEEHMDVVGHPDENEGPNAKVFDNGDMLMTDAPDIINLADPPSHESEITSPYGSEKKGDGLDGAKANQEDVLASQNTIKVEGMLSTADNGEVVNEPQLPNLHEVIELWIQLMWHFRPKEADWSISSSYFSRLLEQNKLANWIFNDHTYPVYIPLNIKNAHWFLVEFQIRTGVVTFYDTLSGLESWKKENLDWWLSLRVMMIEQLSQGMSKHGNFKKKDITFEFSNHAPKQVSLYGDCGVWVCIMMYRLANGLSMDFPPGPIQTALAYREKMTSYFWKYKITSVVNVGQSFRVSMFVVYMLLVGFRHGAIRYGP
ncbi:phospholipase-like protein [Tanacetum coccineum]